MDKMKIVERIARFAIDEAPETINLINAKKDSKKIEEINEKLDCIYDKLNLISILTTIIMFLLIAVIVIILVK